jgi:cyclopropane fatty-acyl-phospholipid synthase-like methyltransferase
MRFDFEETFGDDYLYFSASRLTDEQSDRDTDDIVRILDLHPGDAVLDAPCGHGRISERLAARGLQVGPRAHHHRAAAVARRRRVLERPVQRR